MHLTGYYFFTKYFLTKFRETIYHVNVEHDDRWFDYGGGQVSTSLPNVFGNLTYLKSAKQILTMSFVNAS